MFVCDDIPSASLDWSHCCLLLYQHGSCIFLQTVPLGLLLVITV